MIDSNKDEKIEGYKFKTYYLPKGIFKNCNVILNIKVSYAQPITRNKKWYVEIRKITTGQCKDYTKGCFLDW